MVSEKLLSTRAMVYPAFPEYCFFYRFGNYDMS
jgi:hypothetical protein